jgi:hypothetical protein
MSAFDTPTFPMSPAARHYADAQHARELPFGRPPGIPHLDTGTPPTGRISSPTIFHSPLSRLHSALARSSFIFDIY